MSEIKVGAVVYFVVGGPAMLVSDITRDGTASVNWFNVVTGSFQSDLIPVRYLVLSTCKACGQADTGQTGEYPCKECGLPLTYDA